MDDDNGDQEESLSAETSDTKNFSVRIKHKKCSVVGKIRQQMTDVEQKYKNLDISNFSWKNSYGFIVIFTILLMAWVCIIYGAVIGATLCSNSGTFVPMFRIPGLSWPRQELREWKVF